MITTNTNTNTNTNTQFVATSQFRVASGSVDDVKAAFRARPHLVDSEDGFVRLEVLCPLDAPDEILLLTVWRDRAAYERWHGSAAYRESHSSIPKGIKLVPSATRIRFWEVIAT